jgi:hypothetical protein
MTMSSFLAMLGLTPVTSFHPVSWATVSRRGPMQQRSYFKDILHATDPKATSNSDTTVSDGAKLTSGRKVISFDAGTSRFFEVNDEECIPEDEFCPIDEKTGEKIRLTVEEKERIFLDSLQVRFVLILYNLSSLLGFTTVHLSHVSSLH